MFLDNLLPACMGALASPAALFRRLRHRELVSFGLLANLAAMRRKSVIADIDSVWDVGANQGQFAFMAHSVWPRLPIYSFEPDPECFSRLERNFSKFRIPGRPFNVALGAERREMELVRYAEKVNNSFLPRLSDHHTLQDRITVDCNTLDEIAKRFPEVRSAFLKLDVQGFELSVLNGADDFLGRCRYVLAEVAFSSAYAGGAHADEVMAALRGHGFECIQFVDVLRDADGSVVEADMLFINKHLAGSL
jgi:FkbM family methyltransferase